MKNEIKLRKHKNGTTPTGVAETVIGCVCCLYAGYYSNIPDELSERILYFSVFNVQIIMNNNATYDSLLLN
jgi:hypothetical protein